MKVLLLAPPMARAGGIQRYTATLVLAFRDLLGDQSGPNLTCVIAGDGDDRARLEGLTGKLGLREHTVFTGEVSDAELATLCRRSDVFVVPAQNRG